VKEMKKCIIHNYTYAGLVNVFRRRELLKVYELWKCKDCGATRAGYRTYKTTSPLEGLLDEIDNEFEKWVILICDKNVDTEIYRVKPSDKIKHNCTGGVLELIVDEQYKLKNMNGVEIPGHVSILLEEASPGFIDLTESPPKIVKSKI